MFLSLNKDTLENDSIHQFMRNMIWSFIAIEKEGLYLPTINPENIFITLRESNIKFFN